MQTDPDRTALCHQGHVLQGFWSDLQNSSSGQGLSRRQDFPSQPLFFVSSCAWLSSSHCGDLIHMVKNKMWLLIWAFYNFSHKREMLIPNLGVRGKGFTLLSCHEGRGSHERIWLL